MILGCIIAFNFAQDVPVTLIDLSAMVNEAAVKQRKTLKLLPNRLHLENETVGISNLRGFRLEGVNKLTTLVGHTLRPVLIFERCRDLVVRNLAFDYDPLPYTQAEITGISDGGEWLEYRVLPAYPELEVSYLVNTALFVDARTQLWKEGFPEAYYRTNVAEAPDRGRLSGLVSPWNAFLAPVVGDRLLLATRRAPAILLFDCTNVLFENITIHTAPSAGILARHLEGSNHFSNVILARGPKLQPRMEERLLTTGSSGLIFVGGGGRNLVESCRFTRGAGEGIHTLGAVYPVLSGDGWVFRIEDPHFDLEPYWVTRRRPLSARGLDPATWLPRGMADIIATLREPAQEEGPAPALRVVFESNMPGRLRAGDFLDFPALNGGKLVVRKTLFHDLRGAGLRVGNSEVDVSGCGFERLRDGALVAPAAYPRREAGWTVQGRFVSNALIGREVGGVPHPQDPYFITLTGPCPPDPNGHGTWLIERNFISPPGAKVLSAAPGVVLRP